MNILRKILISLISLFTIVSAQRTPDELVALNNSLEIRSLDANNVVLSRVTNEGDFNTATWSSLKYGTLNAKRILFDAGIWVTGIIDSKVHSGIKYYSANYSPGPIIGGRPAMDAAPEDSSRYRIYKIFRGNDLSNPDFAEWPADFGAPTDANGDPKFFGDQLLWTVYNLYDSTSVDTNYVTERKYGILPVEIQQKVYGREGNDRDDVNIYNNIVFIEWTIINNGSSFIDSAFVGLWCDIDFYNINSNLPAVDVNRETGYLWSGIDYQPSLGGVPPAVGLTMLYGPIKPHPDSTAIFKGKPVNGYYNLPLNAFHAIGDDSYKDPLFGPPRTEKQVYYAANGYTNGGGIIIDSSTSRATKFPFNGDPVTRTGWLFPEEEASDGSGFILFAGPFDLAPKDTQWVMAALVPGLGVNKLESILKMREKIDLINSQPYDTLAFGTDSLNITGIDDEDNELPKDLTLSQNYPNPFNPTTAIKFTVPNTGSYSNTPLRLVVYDILGREIKTLLNKAMLPGTYEINFNASGLPSGVYIYSLKSGTSTLSRKMLLLK